jgi:hypothetical protein
MPESSLAVARTGCTPEFALGVAALRAAARGYAPWTPRQSSTFVIPLRRPLREATGT